MLQPSTNINGTEYELSTTLRVAYLAQGANNHKPYSEIFQNLGEMTLEKQIEILWIAFKVANPEAAKSFGQVAFQEYYMDHFKLKEVMQQLQGVVKGVLGDDEDKTASAGDSSGN